MSVFCEKTDTVDTRDTDSFGHCRPSALLGILQEGATDAANELEASRDRMLSRYNAFWMLARIWYRMSRPLKWGECLTVKTWHRGGKGAAMYRDFDLVVDGAVVGEAVSTWVLADIDTHKIVRLSQVAEFDGTGGGELCKETLLHKLRLPQDLTPTEKRRLHYSDTDINGHVNNARYADFACDALGMETLGQGCFLSELQLGYLAECLPGEEISLFTGEEKGVHYVRGEDGEGKHRFEAAVILSPLPPLP